MGADVYKSLPSLFARSKSLSGLHEAANVLVDMHKKVRAAGFQGARIR
jgi:hypothetical protein